MPKLINTTKLQKGLIIGERHDKERTSSLYMQYTLDKKTRYKKLTELSNKTDRKRFELIAETYFEEFKNRAEKGLPIRRNKFLSILDKYERYLLEIKEHNSQYESRRELLKNGKRDIVGGNVYLPSLVAQELNTIKNYIYPFVRSSKAWQDKETETLRRKDWLEYREYLANEKINENTRAKRLTSMRKIFNFAQARELISEDYSIPNIPPFKQSTKELAEDEILTTVHYEQIIKQAREDYLTADNPHKKASNYLFYLWIIYNANVGHRAWNGSEEHNIPKWRDIKPSWNDRKVGGTIVKGSKHTKDEIWIERFNEKRHTYKALCLNKVKDVLIRLDTLYKAKETKTPYLFAHIHNNRGAKKGDAVKTYRMTFERLQIRLGMFKKVKGKKKALFNPTSLRHFFITQRMYAMDMKLTAGDYLTFAKSCGTSTRMIEKIYTHIMQEQSSSKLKAEQFIKPKNRLDVIDNHGFYVGDVIKGSKDHKEAINKGYTILS